MLWHNLETKTRLCTLLTRCAIVLLVGLFYYLVICVTGKRIPCLFYTITGLYCPGCGITRMAVSLLRLDFEKAFYYQPVLLCSSPLLGACFGYQAFRYVKTGDTKLLWWQNTLIWIVIVALILFCIYRNIT